MPVSAIPIHFVNCDLHGSFYASEGRFDNASDWNHDKCSLDICVAFLLPPTNLSARRLGENFTLTVPFRMEISDQSYRNYAISLLLSPPPSLLPPAFSYKRYRREIPSLGTYAGTGEASSQA